MRAVVTLLAAASLGSAAIVRAKEKAPRISYDPYERTTTITGQVHDHNAFFDLDKWNYWLAASIVAGVARNPILFISTDTPEWFFFESAADVDGNQLHVIKGNRDVRLGGVSELIGVELSPRYLIDHEVTGMNLKIMGSRGAKVVAIPAEVIATFATTYAAEVEKVGGFREDLAAAQAVIAPTQSQATYTAMAGASEAAAHGGFGISFATLPQGVYLVAVAPSGRADQGHLKVGQLITEFNGKRLKGLTQAEVVALFKGATGPATFTVAGLGDLIVP